MNTVLLVCYLLACLASLGVVAWLGFAAGRMTGERRADATIASLRRSLAAARSDREAESARAADLARMLRLRMLAGDKGRG